MPEFAEGAQVKTSDGKTVGVVAELAAEEHFVVQHGNDWELTLPGSAVGRVEGDTVYLALDEEAFEKLPTIPLAKEAKEGEPQEQVELMARVFDSPERIRCMKLTGSSAVSSAAATGASSTAEGISSSF